MTVKIPQLKYLAPPRMSNETDRLDELYSINILDTAAEERFDRLTHLAAIILDTPLAAISLIDADRQWFKSRVGIDLEETPRDISFCGHAIAEDEILVVPDASSDERFRGNPLVTSHPNIRFYAGAVIRGSTGKPIGTCCVLDSKPKQITARQSEALCMIARMIERELIDLNDKTAEFRGRQSAAAIDSATGPSNAERFLQAVESQLNSPTSDEDARMLFAILRVLRFDALDAALGRDAMSYLTSSLAVRINDAIGEKCMVGNIREDKLGIAIPISGTDSVERLLKTLITVAEEDVLLGDHSVRLRVHVGASQYPRDAGNTYGLLRKARTALWSLPLSTKSDYRVFSKRLSESASRKFEIESAIRKGLIDHEFSLAFQPQIRIADGELIGAEALVRWRSSILGDISPDIFIPVAEESGLIHELGDFVLDAACKQIRHWESEDIHCPVLSINITSHQLREPGLTRKVRTLAHKHGIQTARLKLELTESALVDDIKGAADIMLQLRKAGLGIAIDDFGTGFSCLSYLQKLPIDSLKIDRSFISHLPLQLGDRQIVNSIVSMAKALNLSVIAEGVETEAQLDFLRSISCDCAQGFYFSRPLSADDFERFSKSWQTEDIPISHSVTQNL